MFLEFKITHKFNKYLWILKMFKIQKKVHEFLNVSELKNARDLKITRTEKKEKKPRKPTKTKNRSKKNDSRKVLKSFLF